MPYKDKEKQKKYLKDWRNRHKDYFKNWRNRHKDYFTDYYKNNEINKNLKSLRNHKTKDKIRLKNEIDDIKRKRLREQNPLLYKDYWTEDEFYNIE